LFEGEHPPHVFLIYLKFRVSHMFVLKT
jgi:hypothetical protein